MAKSAYVHCTETDKGVDATVVSHNDSKLVVYFGAANERLVLMRSDRRRPYVGMRGKLEFTCLDADIE